MSWDRAQLVGLVGLSPLTSPPIPATAQAPTLCTMPRGQSSGHRALAHLLATHSIATPKQAKEPILSTAKNSKTILNMDQTDKLNDLQEKFEIAKKAISSGQDVDVYSDYYAMDKKLVFRIEVKRTSDEFFNLQENMITKEQAIKLIELKDKGKIK